MLRRAGALVSPVMLIAITFAAWSGGARSAAGASQAVSGARAHIESGGQPSQPGRLPLLFEPNRGQAPSWVRYLAHGSGYTLYLSERGMMLSLTTPTPPRPMSKMAVPDRAAFQPAFREASLSLRPVLANPRSPITTEGRRQGIVNYFIGNDPRKWRTDVPTYSRVVYHGVYPGIDLAFYGSHGRLEYDWILHPHARPSGIAVAIQGAQSLQLDRSGGLRVATAVGVLRQPAPRVYQVVGGRRVAVGGGYRMLGAEAVGFRLDRYDSSRALTIDPVLDYSTYLGGAAAEESIAVDGAGSAYIAGAATTGTIPTRNAYQLVSAGGLDAFITKLNPAGTDLVYSTYIGGSGEDIAFGVAVDATGSAWATGTTFSRDFPMLARASDIETAFVVRLSPAGDNLVFSVSHSPSPDYASGGIAIVIDRAGNVFQCESLSPSPGYNTTWIDKMTPDGGASEFTTVGGPTPSTTAPEAIAADGQGNVYVAGYTDWAAFPVRNAVQTTIGGGSDAFLIKLDAGFNTVYATYLGGGGSDTATGVGVDAAGNVYLAGWTQSTDFPTRLPLQPALLSSVGRFVTEVSASGASLIYSTYITGHEPAAGAPNMNPALAVSAEGTAYLADSTAAYDYPQVNPLPGAAFKGEDAVVTAIAPGGQSLLYSTFLGGSAADDARAIAADQQGDVFVAGHTQSTDFPTTPSAYQNVRAGPASVFVAKLAPPPATPVPSPTAAPPTATTVPPTLTPSPTATFTPTSTPMATAVPTATSTPTAVPTATRVPPAEKPQIFLKSRKVTAGKSLSLTVITSPGATVTLTMAVTSGKTTLYRTSASGSADYAGRWSTSIKIRFHPQKQIQGKLTVKAETAGGSSSSSATFTIVPH